MRRLAPEFVTSDHLGDILGASCCGVGSSGLGGLDSLVNNAALYEGLARRDPLAITTEDWDRVMAVNQRSVFLCIKHAVPALRRGGQLLR